MVPSKQSTWMPWCFDVEVTQLCGLGCKYCYLGRPSSGSMDEATVDEVVRCIDAQASRVEPWRDIQLNLYGGEPFLNFPAVQRLVKGLDEIGGVDAMIFTNGATASVEQVEWCRDHLVKPKRSSAGCPEAAALTRPGQYTERWLAEGVAWREWGNSHRITVIPETAVFPCRNVRWLHQQGYYGPADFALDEYVDWPECAQRAYQEQLERLAREFVRQYQRGCVLGVENFSNFGRAIFGQSAVTVIGCGAGWGTWGITWDGYVTGCHRWFREPRGSTSVGGHVSGIASGAPLHFGEPLVQLVRGWAAGTERAECVECEARQCCSRGCPHVARARTGMLGCSTEVRCWATRLYARLAREINQQVDENWWRKPATPCQPFTLE